MLVEVKVQSLGLDRSSNTPVVILKELDGERVLPIWIGPGEASAIAMRLAEMNFSRPLTHDLLISVMEGLEGRLERVEISRVADSTYYAELTVERNGSTMKVDARPSDSIALALRSEARIWANDELLEQMSFEVSEGEAVLESEEVFPGAPASGAEPASEGEEGTQPMSPEELKEYLRRMNPEDFGRFNP